MDDAGLEAYLNAAAALLDLPLRREDVTEVLEAFRVLSAQAALVMSFPLGQDIEQAPRFVP